MNAGTSDGKKGYVKAMLQIGLVGEFKPEVEAHIAIPQALNLAARELDTRYEATWIPTSQLEQDSEQKLTRYDALWFVPNTPYQSMEGALQAIRYARERRIPALGTCGGCQYMIIEYARNVLGLLDADNAEVNPDAALQIIIPLACSRTALVTTSLLTPGSRVATIYGATKVTEQYGTCNYGPNTQFWPALEQGGMHVTGVDPDGDARIVEIERHPFFIGTLFQPERSAFRHVAHPLIKTLLQAGAARISE